MSLAFPPVVHYGIAQGMGLSGRAIGKVTVGTSSIPQALYLPAAIPSMSLVWDQIWLSGINGAGRREFGRLDLGVGKVCKAHCTSCRKRQPNRAIEMCLVDTTVMHLPCQFATEIAKLVIEKKKDQTKGRVDVERR